MFTPLSMKYTVLVTTTLTDDALAFLNNAKDVEVVQAGADPVRVHKAIGNADALIIRGEIAVDAALLGEGKRLKVIGPAGVWLAGIDVETGTTRGGILMDT